MKRKGSMTVEEMTKLAVDKGDCLKFDVSRITMDRFRDLLNFLPSPRCQFVKGLEFTTDLHDSTVRMLEKDKRSPPRHQLIQKGRFHAPAPLRSSAFVCDKSISSELSSKLSSILCETETLEFLKLRGLSFSFSDLDILFSSIFRCGSLRVLRFCSVPMGDKGFERLCQCLKRRSVTDLQCRRCSLSDKISESLCRLISFHVFVQSESDWMESLSGSAESKAVSLHRLDLRDNEFSFGLIDDISSSVKDSTLKYLDLRGNISIPHQQLESLRKESSVRILFDLDGHSDCESSNGERSDSTDLSGRIESIESENDGLRCLIDSLRRGGSVSEYEPGLFIVGPRSSELVEEVREVDRLLESRESSVSPFSASLSLLGHSDLRPAGSRLISRAARKSVSGFRRSSLRVRH